MRGSAAPIEDLRATLAHIPIKEEDGEVVLSPSSTEEVADVLRYCNERALPLEITGGRTKRTWAGAAEARLILDTTRLNGVREHPWQDLTATVGAGTTWFEMQRVLAAHNQFVALDPLWPEHATVGGVLATNDSGALRVKYGSARDLVIGMTLVLADGTIAKTGGKVVKNVAGYDLHKLMIGAFGTLAVTTEVTFRLHPLRSSRATWRMVAASVRPRGVAQQGRSAGCNCGLKPHHRARTRGRCGSFSATRAAAWKRSRDARQDHGASDRHPSHSLRDHTCRRRSGCLPVRRRTRRHRIQGSHTPELRPAR
jgi:FAD/FMN-containing dehydrogenase